ncbi:hypothetical protein B0J12DRAFT_221588 [Macrophomina phaseolina]|uniref:Uncharacterized protein n=1 Tax=Macrophomina phaseolina TaxID=35725 RepID=A0ABQ8G0N7_9PEZI|nr:hypothetical protein B0J12DRAFT_221588 [Macrophomina phaseolina]
MTSTRNSIHPLCCTFASSLTPHYSPAPASPWSDKNLSRKAKATAMAALITKPLARKSQLKASAVQVSTKAPFKAKTRRASSEAKPPWSPTFDPASSTDSSDSNIPPTTARHRHPIPPPSNRRSIAPSAVESPAAPPPPLRRPLGPATPACAAGESCRRAPSPRSPAHRACSRRRPRRPTCRPSTAPPTRATASAQHPAIPQRDASPSTPICIACMRRTGSSASTSGTSAPPYSPPSPAYSAKSRPRAPKPSTSGGGGSSSSTAERPSPTQPNYSANSPSWIKDSRLLSTGDSGAHAEESNGDCGVRYDESVFQSD